MWLSGGMSDSGVESVLAAKFARLLPHLNERQRRLAVAAAVAAVGRGGVSVVARASGLSRPTVYRGLAELEGPVLESGWARAAGGGRKRLVQIDPGLVEALEALIGPTSRGDPGSQLRWTTKSLRALSGELTRQGHRAGADTVADLLREEGFSLQGNAKTIEGNQVRDRDAQFRYLNERVREHRDAGEPVILNAGAFTHTSVALRDACAELSAPLIEVHISNVHAREEFRRHSYVSPVATGVIVGLGVQGYLLALRYLASR